MRRGLTEMLPPWLALREEQKGKEGGRREGGRREERVVAVDAVTLPE